jgi:hypothetical protein
MSGFSSSRVTSSRRSTFRSKSKIPPERGEALGEVGDLVAQGIEFDHGGKAFAKKSGIVAISPSAAADGRESGARAKVPFMSCRGRQERRFTGS